MSLAFSLLFKADANQAKAEIKALKGGMTSAEAEALDLAKKMQTASTGVDGLGKSGIRTAGELRQLAAPISAVTSGGIANANSMRMMAQQLSQVGQQTMATGDFIQALAIQLPDIGIGFGAIGAAAGLLAGIALPVLMSAFGGTQNTAQALGDALDQLNADIEATNGLAKIMAGDLTDLKARFGAVTPEIMAMARAQSQIKLRTLADDAKAVKAELIGMFSDGARSDLEAIHNVLDLTQASSEHLGLSLDWLARHQGLSEQVTQIAAIRADFVAAVGSVDQMTEAQLTFYSSLVDTEDALRAVKQRTDEIDPPLNSMIGLIYDFVTGADSAAAAVGNIGAQAASVYGSVSALAGAIWSAANARVSAAKYVAANQRGGAAYLANQYEMYGAGHNAGVTAANASDDLYGGPKSTGTKRGGNSGGGGGAAAANAEKDAVGALIKKLQEEADLARQLDPVKAEMLKHRKELATATGAEKAKVEELIRAEIELKNVRDLTDFMNTSTMDLLKGLAAGGDQAANAMKRLGASILDVALQALVMGKGPLAGLLGISGGLFDWIGRAKGGPVPQGHATGGIILGAGGPREDAIPMYGSAGEYMVNAKATSKHRALLDRINYGSDLPVYATGGIIGGAAVLTGSSARNDQALQVHNHIYSPTGNTEIHEMVLAATKAGIEQYDREALPFRVKQISTNQRTVGR